MGQVIPKGVTMWVIKIIARGKVWSANLSDEIGSAGYGVDNAIDASNGYSTAILGSCSH